jgi:hypothetical protein
VEGLKGELEESDYLCRLRGLRRYREPLSEIEIKMRF